MENCKDLWRTPSFSPEFFFPHNLFSFLLATPTSSPFPVSFSPSHSPNQLTLGLTKRRWLSKFTLILPWQSGDSNMGPQDPSLKLITVAFERWLLWTVVSSWAWVNHVTCVVWSCPVVTSLRFQNNLWSVSALSHCLLLTEANNVVVVA